MMYLYLVRHGEAVTEEVNPETVPIRFLPGDIIALANDRTGWAH